MLLHISSGEHGVFIITADNTKASKIVRWAARVEQFWLQSWLIANWTPCCLSGNSRFSAKGWGLDLKIVILRVIEAFWTTLATYFLPLSRSCYFGLLGKSVQRCYWLLLSLSQSPKSAPHLHQTAVSSTCKCFRGSCGDHRKRGLWYLTCNRFKTTSSWSTNHCQLGGYSEEISLCAYPALMLFSKNPLLAGVRYWAKETCSMTYHGYSYIHYQCRYFEQYTPVASTLSRRWIFWKVIQILPENITLKPKPQWYCDIPLCNCTYSGSKQNSWKTFTNSVKQLTMIWV